MNHQSLRMLAKKAATLGTVLASLPCTLYAADSVTNIATGIGTFAGLINGFTQTVVKATGGLLMAGAMVAFFYGIVEYIWGSREGKPEKIATGNKFIGWSLVALFCMFSVYGIIRFGQGILFNGEDVTKITIPELDFRINNTGANPGNGGTPTRQNPFNPGNGGSPSSRPGSGGGVTPSYNGSMQDCVNAGNSAGECGRIIDSGSVNDYRHTGYSGQQGSACQYASDCNGALQCVNGVCAQKLAECETDADCTQNGYECSNGQCVLGN